MDVFSSLLFNLVLAVLVSAIRLVQNDLFTKDIIFNAENPKEFRKKSY